MKDFLFEPVDAHLFTMDKFRRETAKLSHPLSINWEVTNACNLNCTHCALESGRSLAGEPDTDEALKLIDEFAGSGVRHLLLIGGEPLLRPDITEIVARAVKKMFVGITTNGHLLPLLARDLKDLEFPQVRVSLDGAGPETHDQLRGEGSFQRAVEGVRKCVELGFNEVGIEATISKLNLSTLPDMIKMASELGVKIFEARELLAAGRGRALSHLTLNSDERRWMHKYLAAVRRSYGDLLVVTSDPYMILANDDIRNRCCDPFHSEVATGCSAGVLGCGVTPDLKVIPCPTLRLEVGDLRKQGLLEIWRNSPQLKMLRARDVGGKCGRCEYKFLCGGCRGSSSWATGDYLGEDPRCWYNPQLQGDDEG